MTSQSCMRVCCKCVAAAEVNECGLGICNYYSQADECLILPDGRAPLWVPGHAWEFQTDTLCRNTLQDAWARRGEFCALFWKVFAGLWSPCNRQVCLGLDACISILCHVLGSHLQAGILLLSARTSSLWYLLSRCQCTTAEFLHPASSFPCKCLVRKTNKNP